MNARASTLDLGSWAEVAAEAVRTLNHLTLNAPSAGTPGCADVGDLYRVLAQVGLLIERLRPVLHQFAQHLDRSVDSCETDDAAPSVVLTLGDAQEHLRRVGESIGSAHSATTHLYMPVPMRVGASISAHRG